MVKSVAYVDFELGNDSTGTFDDPLLPFKTPQHPYSIFTGTSQDDTLLIMLSQGNYGDITLNKDITLYMEGINEIFTRFTNLTIETGFNTLRYIGSTLGTFSSPSKTQKTFLTLQECDLSDVLFEGGKVHFKAFNTRVRSSFVIKENSCLLARILYCELDTNIKVNDSGIVKIYLTSSKIKHTNLPIIDSLKQGTIFCSFQNCDIVTQSNYLFSVSPKLTYITINNSTFYPGSFNQRDVYLFDFKEAVKGTGFFYFQASNMSVQNKLNTQQTFFHFSTGEIPEFSRGSSYQISLFGFNGGITLLEYPQKSLTSNEIAVLTDPKTILNHQIDKVIYKGSSNGTITLPNMVGDTRNSSITFINSSSYSLKILPNGQQINMGADYLEIPSRQSSFITYYSNLGWLN